MKDTLNYYAIAKNCATSYPRACDSCPLNNSMRSCSEFLIPKLVEIIDEYKKHDAELFVHGTYGGIAYF